MNKSNIKTNIALTIRAIKTMQQLEKSTLPFAIILALLSSISPFINLYLSARIIDELVGNRNPNTLIKYVIIMIFSAFLLSVTISWITYIRNYKYSKIWEGKNLLINEKIMSMDYEYLEQNGIRNKRRDLDEIQNINGGGLENLFWQLEPLFKNGFTLIISVAIVAGVFSKNVKLIDSMPYLSGIINAGLIIIIFIFIFIMMLNISKVKKKVYQCYNLIMPINRMGMFYAWEYLVDPRPGKDIRMFRQKPIISRQMDQMIKSIGKIESEIGKFLGRSTGINSGISAFLGGLVYMFLAIQAAYRAISIGSVVNYAGCITRFISSFSDFIENISEINANSQYLKPYFEFMDIPNIKYKGTIPVEKRQDDLYELEFRNVSFKYPGSEEYVLKDFSLKLKIGERLAVIGRNGSGKTTFIKLLCRLYDPTEGEILLNGIDIKKYNYNEYMSIFSVVFQDFHLLSMGLGENVATAVEYDHELVTEALEKVGLGQRLAALEKGLDTPLYKDYDQDGVEISGGEAQKVAIARALYHNAPFVILDEPTAALDPLAEYDIYSKFDTLVGTKTAIYISHRLASCRFCNDIAVFQDGRIVERGCHEELVKNTSGLYYEMWQAQAQYYTKEA